MVKRRCLKILILFLLALTASNLRAQGEKAGLKYEFASNVDLSSIKDPILQLNVDNVGYLYLRTYKKLYLYDCNTVAEGAIVTTIDLAPPEKALFLVNNKGKICFAKTDEPPAQIFSESGELMAALGEMKTPKETYREVNQIFIDSRNYYILAEPRKILYFNPQGNFDVSIEFERPFKIIHLDNKDNIYMLRQSILSPEMKADLEKIDNILSRIEEDLKLTDSEIQKIRDDRDGLSEDIDGFIKEKKDKFENLRELQKSPDTNKTWIDNLKQEIDNLQKKIDEAQTEREDLYKDYQKKSEERKKIKEEEVETAKDKGEILRKAKENARQDEYEIAIYDTMGELIFSFVLLKSPNSIPMFNIYNIYSDEENNFFGVPVSQDSDLNVVLNPLNEYKAIKGGAGRQVNVYNSNGEFITKIEAEPPFEGINHIALDSKRNLYVLDQSFSRLRKFKLVGAGGK